MKKETILPKRTGTGRLGKLLLSLTVALALISGMATGQTVYITKTGAKYHRSDCRYLSHSKIETTLSEALATGYQPCKICQPPQMVQSQNQITPNSGQNSNQNTKSKSTSVQCSGTTQSGSRCKRMTTSPNGKCWQHGG